MTDETDTKAASGRRRVSAVSRMAETRLKRKMAAQEIVWPDKGGKHKGVSPGQWRHDGPFDESGCLPADCPVKPLGYEGENYFFVDTSGQVFATGDKALSVERSRKLFAGHPGFLYWAWPSYGRGKNPPVNGFKNDELHEDLYAACRKKGPWNMVQMVRGRGAWRDERGHLVLHCGETLYIDGQMHETGEHGDHFYVRRPATFEPWGEAVEEPDDNPAVTLVELLRSWNFVRGDTDVMLVMGWLGVALMGAALDWRPSVFITGDAGTGKSELLHLLKGVLGRAMISTTNATEAGLYQIVGHDSLPIAVDELEGEDGQAQAQRIIKMARDAASGSMRIRGGADHKGVEFEAKSTFVFSAINPPGLPPASLTRLAIIQTRPLNPGGKKPVLHAAETIGPRLLRRVMDHFNDFLALYEGYQEALRDNGHDSRGQNTFGTFLAAAHTLLGDSGMDVCRLPFENLHHWGAMLHASSLPELSGKQENWLQCVEDILTSQVDAWQKGERQTVGQVLDDLVKERDLMDLNRANKVLGIAGLGVVGKGIAGEGFGLAVPNSGRDINRLLTNTSFEGRGGAGGWAGALRQGPETIIKHRVVMKRRASPDNRMTIAGAQRRCTFIDLAALKEFQEKGQDDG